MSSISAGRLRPSRKPQKGSILSSATVASSVDGRTPQSMDPPTAGYQQFVNVSTEEIAHRAYELFVARGRAHGRDVDDWLLAERELMRGATERQPSGGYDDVLG